MQLDQRHVAGALCLSVAQQAAAWLLIVVDGAGERNVGGLVSVLFEPEADLEVLADRDVLGRGEAPHLEQSLAGCREVAAVAVPPGGRLVVESLVVPGPGAGPGVGIPVPSFEGLLRERADAGDPAIRAVGPEVLGDELGGGDDVVVEEDADRAPRGLDRGVSRRRLADRPELQDLHSQGRFEAFQHGGGVVGRAVVGDDDLERRQVIGLLLQRAQAAHDQILAVVRRDHNACVWSWRREHGWWVSGKKRPSQ